MKKISLYAMGFLMGAALVACDDYKEPNPPAQYNPQQPVFSTEGVTVVDMIDPLAVYDLEALNMAGDNIIVASVAVEELAPGYTMGAQAYISPDDFETQLPVATSLVETLDEEGNTYYLVEVAPQAIQDVYVANVTLNPAPATIGISALLTVQTENTVAYVGGPDNYYAQTPMQIIPMPSDFVIEDAYYLIGTIDDWSVAGAVKFNHSTENVYDDPVFSITITITPEQAEAGWWWKIIPQSVFESGEWSNEDYSQFGPAVDGDSAASGKLVPKMDGKDPGAGDFKESGPWQLTINMMDLTYEFTKAIESLWVVGEATGWSWDNAQELVTSDYVTYTGFGVLGDGFKFGTAKSWDDPAYGAGEEDGEISTAGGNITIEKEGLYWINVDLNELTYKATEITAISMIGGFNDWGGDVEMTSEDYLIWKGTLTLTATSEFKFRMNNDWAINLGGTFDDLVLNGGNLEAEAGTYAVTLDLSKVPYSATIVKE